MILPLVVATLAQAVAQYSHVPLSTFRSAVGEKQHRVGLYSVTVCNPTTAALAVDEGRLIQVDQISVISPALNLTILETAHKPNKKHKLFLALGFLSDALSTLPGPSKGPQMRYFSALGGATFRRLAQEFRPVQTPASIVQALAVPNRTISLPVGGCDTRLFFGEYRGTVAPFAKLIP
jgi:hypothetical protein